MAVERRDGFWLRGGWAQAIGVGLAAGIVGMLGRAVLQPLLGDDLPFLFAYPAIVYVTLRHGVASGGVALGLCLLWAASPLVPPVIAAADRAAQLGSFGVAGVITALLSAQCFSRFDSLNNTPAGTADAPLSRWLRGVLWGAVLVPLAAFAAACGWAYVDAFDEGRAAAVQSNRVVLEHAHNTLDVAMEVLRRTQALVAVPDAQLRTEERAFHERLNDFLVGVPPVFAVHVVDRDGQPLVNSRRFPVDARLNASERAYFKAHRRQAGSAAQVTGLEESRQSGQTGFNLSAPRVGPNGTFEGVISVSLLPQSFQKFYESLAARERGRNTFLLLMDNGELLTRWPPPAEGTVRMPAANALMPALQGRPASGIVQLTSSFDGVKRLVSFQRVGELPLYVTAGLSEATILEDWYRFVSLLAAFVVPITAGLVYVTWLALLRTQRHEVVWAELQAEMGRRTQAERALLQSQKLEALGQLTGGVAHDFNNLLGIVSNNAYLLKRVVKEPQAVGPLAAIGRATTSGVKLTRQLLSFARKHALKPEILRLQDWLPATGDLLGTTMGSRIVMSIEVQGDTPTIRVDPSELELALINLAVNARHAMPGGGRVSVEARALDDPRPGEPQPGVRISFSDTGAGIPADVVARVFEPFFTTKAPGEGSGLGLSQVYGLCQQAGGTARVHSVEGQGTTVSLIFPAQPAHAGDRAGPETVVPSQLHGSVLMVEDNDELAAAQETLLRSVGLDVERVSRADRAETLARSADANFDIVLSDVMMPGPFDGIELAFRLRAARPELPLILITGYAQQIETAARAGFVVLGKPVEPDVLFAAIGKALWNKR